MAPSVAETLYALGLGDRVVGVTRDCNYPPEVEYVRQTGDIGGFYDPNIEAIVTLRPDLVVLLEEQSNWATAFEKLKIETLVVCHKTTEGIIESFGVIGRVCGAGAQGRRMERDFRDRLARVRDSTKNLKRPRVLFVVDRPHDTGHLADLYIAADDDYFDTVIRLAGGENAYGRRGVRYPVVSPEGILWLNPDVIVDLVPSAKTSQFGRQAVLADWNELKQVRAVREHKVLIPDRDFALIPGPRFVELVEYLAGEIHPEIKDRRLPTNALDRADKKAGKTTE